MNIINFGLLELQLILFKEYYTIPFQRYKSIERKKSGASNAQRWVCRTFKSDLSSTTKCNQNHIFEIMNWVTPKAGAKGELLLNKPASGNKIQNINKN